MKRPYAQPNRNHSADYGFVFSSLLFCKKYILLDVVVKKYDILYHPGRRFKASEISIHFYFHELVSFLIKIFLERSIPFE